MLLKVSEFVTFFGSVQSRAKCPFFWKLKHLTLFVPRFLSLRCLSFFLGVLLLLPPLFFPCLGAPLSHFFALKPTGLAQIGFSEESLSSPVLHNAIHLKFHMTRYIFKKFYVLIVGKDPLHVQP